MTVIKNEQRQENEAEITGLLRCLETEIFVIIFIALFLDCDKKLSCVRKRSTKASWRVVRKQN
jgi:hypothetical protein